MKDYIIQGIFFRCWAANGLSITFYLKQHFQELPLLGWLNRLSFFLFFLLSTTTTLNSIYKIHIRFWKWREEGRWLGNLELEEQERTEFPECSSCLIYLRPGAEESQKPRNIKGCRKAPPKPALLAKGSETGVRGDHVGSFDIHCAVELRCSSSPWGGVKGSLVESKDFYHHSVVTRWPYCGVSGTRMSTLA